MTIDEIKRWWFDLFGVKFKNSATYRAVEAKLEQICNAHDAELKAKDEQIAELKAGAKNSAEIYAKQLAAKDKKIIELQAMVQNMCATCECAKFADNAIKPSEMWKLHTMLKDNK